VSTTNKQGITIHTEEEFEGMRKAGSLSAECLDMIGDHVKPGVTTGELNDLCHKFIIERGAIPAPLNYKGFPKSVCTSVNHVVCHGIPDDKKLKEGDILNIDVTSIIDGWHGDTSRMYFVGKKIPVKAKILTEVTYNAFMNAVKIVRPGISLWDIGDAIQSYIDNHKTSKFSIVEDYCGHGLGKVFHAAPNVLHYRTEQAKKVILEEGMFFTIEPMINVGKKETILSQNDGWTVTTRDKSLSAQFEHSIGVTKDGHEIFTESPTGKHNPFC